jgi:phosphoserine aminotransferase
MSSLLTVKMTRGYNFGAGPAMLPESLLREVQAELLDWHGLGMSVMEVGHRTEAFKQLLLGAEVDLRALLHIPEHYQVLFLSGATRTQFAMVPLNLIRPPKQAGYLISGVWSAQAYEEAARLSSAYCIASAEAAHFNQLPVFNEQCLRDETAYVYYTPNETINGIQFPSVPEVKGLPLIADMTSCLLTEPIRVTDFGLIFAGTQKNIAPAGLTIVIIRNDLLQAPPASVIPLMLDYRTHTNAHSLYATPATFQCYVAAKMFQWIKAQGGVEALHRLNVLKSAALYNYIDSSSYYRAPVDPLARSMINVCFFLNDPTQEADFLREAQAQGLYALQGHRLVGGLRASLYNAMPMEGVNALIGFMQDFAAARAG